METLDVCVKLPKRSGVRRPLGLMAHVILLGLALTLLGILAVPTAAMAAGGTMVKQGCLTFEVFNDYAVLKEYDGSQAYVTIPSSVNGRTVTEMDSYSNSRLFYFKESIRSVTVPGTITNIPKSTFTRCSNLQSVTYQNGVKTVEDYFSYCTSLTSVSFPSTVTKIGGFTNCSSLESVALPSGIRELPAQCFRDCSSLRSITIPSGVTALWGSAFENCGSLTSVTIPASCSVIGLDCFRNCGNLKTVEILAPSVDYAWGGGCFKNLAANSVIYVQNNEVYEKTNTIFVITPERTRVVNRHPYVAPKTSTTKTNEMYRLYNPNSGEHFYTANSGERDHLKQVGWRYEGVGWNAPTTGSEVYRLYNANAGDHHYTASKNERDMLVRQGWKYEGVGWYSGGSKPLYRQYNPNAVSGSHNYTTSKNENDQLVRVGWRAEGIGWYGM